MNPQQPQSLTEKARESVANYLYDELERGVKRGFEIANDYPGFIADTAPAPPVYRAAKAMTRQACRAWARGSTPIRGPVADAVYGPLCEPYLDSIGEMPGDGSLNPPDFQGGQCPARYTVIADRYSLATGALSQANQVLNSNALGPLSLVSGGNDPPPGGCTTGTFSPGTRMVTGGGDTFTVSGSGCSEFHPQFRNIRVTRNDGLPDDCGSLPPTYTPPVTVPGLPPLPPVQLDVPGVGPIGVNVEFNPDGTVTVTLPDLGIEVTKGDPSDTRPPGELPPGDQGDPGPAAPVPPGGSQEGEAPDGFVLVGLRISNLVAPDSAPRFAPGVFRGVCYIYMGGSDGLDQDFAGSQVRDGQFIFAERQNLTRWRVAANVGFSFTVTPYYTRDSS